MVWFDLDVVVPLLYVKFCEVLLSLEVSEEILYIRKGKGIFHYSFVELLIVLTWSVGSIFLSYKE
jgi:hypothetical protein